MSDCFYRDCHKDSGNLEGTSCDKCGKWYCGYHDGLPIKYGQTLCSKCLKEKWEKYPNINECGYRECQKYVKDANENLDNICDKCLIWYCDNHRIFSRDNEKEICILCKSSS